MTLPFRAWSCVVAMVLMSTVTAAQSPAAAPPVFEAASVKVNTGSSQLLTSTLFQRSSQLSITNHPVRLLMAIAFRLNLNQAGAHIVGLPGWADSDGFDIQAAMAGTPSSDDKRAMLRALLADRFKLAFHRETRQLPVFGLAQAAPGRPGALLRPPTDETTCEQPPGASPSPAPRARTPLDAAVAAVRDVPCGRITGGILGDDRSQAWAGGRRVSLAMLAASLGEITPLDLAVVRDRTDVQGLFDLVLVWNPQIQELSANGTDASGLTFTQALREQLGLRLQRETGPVEVLVVDRLERPTPD